MNRDELLDRVKRAIHDIEPNAEVILYGSRSRGDYSAQSDWDFLILVDGPADRNVVTRIRNNLYDIELQANMVLSSIIRSRDEWNSPRYSVLPLKRAVEEQGVSL